MIVKIIMLVVFFTIMISVGFLCKKKSNDVNSFVLGGRGVGAWLSAFAYGTSYFSAVIFIGYAGQFGWKFGLASTLIGVGNALIGSLFAWKILAKRTRLMSQKLNSSTMPDFFGKRFDNHKLRTISSLIIFIFLIPYTASLYNGLSRLFSMAFNVDYSICIIVMAILTGIYVVSGGYLATAINDFIQGIIMLFGISAVIIAVLNVNGGLLNSITSMSLMSDPTLNASAGDFTSILGADPLSLISVIFLTSFGTWGLPQMVQKFYSIKDEKAIKIGTVISTLFALVVAGGCYFLGGFGRLFATTEEVSEFGYDFIVPKMLEGLSPFLIGVIVILVLSASMSTLSSLVMASSSTLSLDFINANRKVKMNEKQKLTLIKIFIIIFITISVIIAIIQHSSSVTFIAQLMGISWGSLAGAFLAPYLLSLYSKKITSSSVLINFIFSTTVMILNMICPNIFPSLLKSPINCGALCMLLGFAIVPIISTFTSKLDDKVIENCFECIEQN